MWILITVVIILIQISCSAYIFRYFQCKDILFIFSSPLKVVTSCFFLNCKNGPVILLSNHSYKHIRIIFQNYLSIFMIVFKLYIFYCVVFRYPNFFFFYARRFCNSKHDSMTIYGFYSVLMLCEASISELRVRWTK